MNPLKNHVHPNSFPKMRPKMSVALHFMSSQCFRKNPDANTIRNCRTINFRWENEVVRVVERPLVARTPLVTTRIYSPMILFDQKRQKILCIDLYSCKTVKLLLALVVASSTMRHEGCHRIRPSFRAELIQGWSRHPEGTSEEICEKCKYHVIKK